MMPISLGYSASNAAAAGGGNVFNGAPLFGNYSGSGGSSEGNDGASATAAASGQGPAAAAATPLQGGSNFDLSQYTPYILLAGGAFLVVVIVKKFLL
jgi:hypothetical protein